MQNCNGESWKGNQEKVISCSVRYCIRQNDVARKYEGYLKTMASHTIHTLLQTHNQAIIKSVSITQKWQCDISSMPRINSLNEQHRKHYHIRTKVITII